MTNIELKEQLLKKGYYVQDVGIQDEPDYLIVSVHEPQLRSECKEEKLPVGILRNSEGNFVINPRIIPNID